MARTKKSSVAPVEVETIVSEVVGEMEVTTELAPVEVETEAAPEVETEAAPEVETEAAPEVETSLPSLISQVSALSTETKVKKAKSTKNENVWGNVKMLFDAGKTNKETLAEIHEMYGNEQTTYACIAWYRNKYNKIAKSDKMTVEQLLNQIGCQFGQDQNWVAAQLSKV
jgi:hypothetical protein